MIRNPEVQELVPSLLAAIADPSNKARPALDKVLAMRFVHEVDAPSLALIVPVRIAILIRIFRCPTKYFVDFLFTVSP